MRDYFKALPRNTKRLLALLFDILTIWFCLWLALYFRLEPDALLEPVQDYWVLFVIAPVIAIPVFIKMGLYQAVVRYIGSWAIAAIVQSSFFAAVGLVIVVFFISPDIRFPRTAAFLYGIFLIITMLGARFFIQNWLLGHINTRWLPTFIRRMFIQHNEWGKPVLIYGAGDAGIQLMAALDKGKEFRPVGFIDSDPQICGQVIGQRRVYADGEVLNALKSTSAQEILLAIPGSPSKRHKVVCQLEQYEVPVRSMPCLMDIASGRLKIDAIQEVDIADILGRKEVDPIPDLLDACIREKVVLVTGAGGSIGAELCRQILQIGPKTLVLFEHSEYNLYAIEKELTSIEKHLNIKVRIIPVLGSVNDAQRLVDVMVNYNVQTVYHAAAYKHVPIVEHNLSQGIRNNVIGTLYTAQAAMIAKVDKFVLISTDKAVRPTNVMGASKRLAEMILQALNKEESIELFHSWAFYPDEKVKIITNQTCFTMVRFGNVLDSSGSVIPLFRDQIRQGGPVTVTHKEITRYFMTIREAASLVIQAGSMSSGGDVFVLDMGESVKIDSLAKRMITLSGFSVKDEFDLEGDIEIIYAGLRPGEKLYEELLIGDDVSYTVHPKICKAKEEMIPWENLSFVLDEILCSIKNHDYGRTHKLLLEYINGFKPSAMMVDWLHPSLIQKSHLE
ncbi:polysaccharide biosynthesis protein [Endozoicomonadaceae bacterium StTr2]